MADRYKSFPGVVCQRIRNLNQAISDIGEKRKAAFEARDNAIDQLAHCGESEVQRQVKLKADHSDAVLLIETLQRQLAWARSQLSQTIKQADQGDLFEDAEIQIPLFDHKDPDEAADDPDQPSLGEESEPDPETDGAKANARMDAEESDDEFMPGVWECHSGGRGRGKQVQASGPSDMDAFVSTLLEPQFASGKLSGDIEINTKGGAGDVKVNGKSVLSLKRVADLPATEVKPVASGKMPAPKWGAA